MRAPGRRGGGAVRRAGAGRGRRAGALVAALLVACAIAAGAAAPAAAALAPQDGQEDPFPHREHSGLFPLCTGCHQGVPEGEREAFYPARELCANCHDGDQVEEVTWTPPGERAPTRLRFRHPDHADAARREGEASACTDCHNDPGEPRMAVEGVAASRCLSCHAHSAREHYADAECSTCHRPLAETRLSLESIESLPEPGSHDGSDFLADVHGEEARASTATCSTCHTRERCTSCHVEGTSNSAVAELAAAPREMSLPAFEARYPTPPSHERSGWLERHGRGVEAAECSTCHTRQSCTSCHRESRPEVVGKLADRSAAAAPGVEAKRRPPESHDSPFFAQDHAAQASASPGTCTSCHARTSCTECHAAESGSEFHPDNFLARHSSAAYGARLECSNCHNAAVFCRDCHQKLGMQETEGVRGGGAAFHTGQPLWLLRHGQAARQGLESCASCHEQRDCLQCHSTTGAFQVNPHGPGFDAERYSDRNREICFACHLDDPLDGSTP